MLARAKDFSGWVHFSSPQESDRLVKVNRGKTFNEKKKNMYMRNSPHKLVTSVLKMLLECTCNEKSDIYHLLDYYTRVRKTENGVFKSKMHDLFILQNTHTQPSTNGEYSRINMYNKGNLIKIKSSQYRGYLKGTKNIYI